MSRTHIVLHKYLHMCVDIPVFECISYYTSAYCNIQSRAYHTFYICNDVCMLPCKGCRHGPIFLVFFPQVYNSHHIYTWLDWAFNMVCMVRCCSSLCTNDHTRVSFQIFRHKVNALCLSGICCKSPCICVHFQEQHHNDAGRDWLNVFDGIQLFFMSTRLSVLDSRSTLWVLWDIFTLFTCSWTFVLTVCVYIFTRLGA